MRKGITHEQAQKNAFGTDSGCFLKVEAVTEPNLQIVLSLRLGLLYQPNIQTYLNPKFQV